MTKKEMIWNIALILLVIAIAVTFFKPVLLPSPGFYDYEYIESEPEYVFDDNDNLVEINHFPNGEPYYIDAVKYEYDLDNNLIKEKKNFFIKNSLYDYINEYSYDLNGNLIYYSSGNLII